MADHYDYLFRGGDERAVADSDFGELETHAQVDGDAHAAGETCAYCGETIMAFQAARRVREVDWIHDGCRRPSRRAK